MAFDQKHGVTLLPGEGSLLSLATVHVANGGCVSATMHGFSLRPSSRMQVQAWCEVYRGEALPIARGVSTLAVPLWSWPVTRPPSSPPASSFSPKARLPPSLSSATSCVVDAKPATLLGGETLRFGGRFMGGQNNRAAFPRIIRRHSF